MNRTEKEQVVADLRAGLQEARSVVLTSHMGIEVNTVNELRSEFRKAGVHYQVVKNTLARLAIAGTEFEAIDEFLKGPTALAFSMDDAPAPAKIAKKFSKDHDSFVIKGGFLPGEGLLDEDGVNRLSELLSKEELLAKLLGTFKAGPEKFVRTLSAAPQKFVRVLSARRDDLAA